MSLITHPATGFAIGDPDRLPLTAKTLPSPAEIEAATSTMILSASGWRKIFAAGGKDSVRASWAGAARGDASDLDDSLSELVSPANLVLAGAAAIVFGEYLVSRSGTTSPALLVGIDTRPTGPTLADAMIRVLLGMGLLPRHLFIVAAPEIMAYSRLAAALPKEHEERAEGFCYVSASHNPPGHNGLKFGRGGGVMPGAEMKPLIEAFRSLCRDPRLPSRVLGLMEAADKKSLARVFTECQAWKRRSISAYTLFSHEVVTGQASTEEQARFLDEMAEAAADRPLGIVAELNGSARCLSIDLDFLDGLGLVTKAVNERPRAFSHRIVPEGSSLEECRIELEKARALDPAFVLGYVPDCDGDRGNLVWFDENRESALPLEAQEVFALCCVAELAQLVRDGSLSHDGSGNAREKVAVVVNDATSMRVNAVARAFDVDVFRAETGEANVVGLAASLREKGYVVRLLGEGSNGGNITHPSAVRDPLATLGAILKILLLRESGVGSAEQGVRGEGLFHIWMRLSNQVSRYRPDFSLADVVASMPAYATTSIFESRAALRVSTGDHALLKSRFATIFERQWKERKAELVGRFGVSSWEAFATNGIAERKIGPDFAASGQGGLRIVFSGDDAKPKAFLWMRGSGTEAVFRIMSDVEGGMMADEEYFLAWLESMVREADRG